jgi:hypothetical protein
MESSELVAAAEVSRRVTLPSGGDNSASRAPLRRLSRQIAYIDFLDLSGDYANHHKISYDIPRICNVTSDDFSFVANVDRNVSNPARSSYGIVEVI